MLLLTTNPPTCTWLRHTPGPHHRNAAGYDAAVRWRARFTHISPVWYQLRLDQEGALVLVGGHDVDAGWMGRLRAPAGLVRCRRCSSSRRLTGGLPACWLQVHRCSLRCSAFVKRVPSVLDTIAVVLALCQAPLSPPFHSNAMKLLCCWSLPAGL